jgi:hypothetical protein
MITGFIAAIFVFVICKVAYSRGELVGTKSAQPAITTLQNTIKSLLQSFGVLDKAKDGIIAIKDLEIERLQQSIEELQELFETTDEDDEELVAVSQRPQDTVSSTARVALELADQISNTRKLLETNREKLDPKVYADLMAKLQLPGVKNARTNNSDF